MKLRSVWAVVAGILLIIVGTTLVDIVLHLAGIYAPMGQPMTEAQALLATAYRLVIGIGGAWLTARLAPTNPMKHAMALGYIGSGLALVGLAATWKLDLSPKWYPIALVVLAIPQCWAGGRLFELRSN